MQNRVLSASLFYLLLSWPCSIQALTLHIPLPSFSFLKPLHPIATLSNHFMQFQLSYPFLRTQSLYGYFEGDVWWIPKSSGGDYSSAALGGAIKYAVYPNLIMGGSAFLHSIDGIRLSMKKHPCKFNPNFEWIIPSHRLLININTRHLLRKNINYSNLQGELKIAYDWNDNFRIYGGPYFTYYEQRPLIGGIAAGVEWHLPSIYMRFIAQVKHDFNDVKFEYNLGGNPGILVGVEFALEDKKFSYSRSPLKHYLEAPMMRKLAFAVAPPKPPFYVAPPLSTPASKGGSPIDPTITLIDNLPDEDNDSEFDDNPMEILEPIPLSGLKVGEIQTGLKNNQTNQKLEETQQDSESSESEEDTLLPLREAEEILDQLRSIKNDYLRKSMTSEGMEKDQIVTPLRDISVFQKLTDNQILTMQDILLAMRDEDALKVLQNKKDFDKLLAPKKPKRSKWRF